MKRSGKAFTAAAAIIAFFACAALCVDFFVPTARYYLKYHTPFYRGNDYSSLEYASDIPYDEYISEVTAEQVSSITGFSHIIPVDGDLQAAINSAPPKSIVVVSQDITVPSLKLKSDMCLFIQKGTVLTVTGYRKANSSTKGENEVESDDTFRFIEADSASNIYITGGGTVRGTDKEYWQSANLVTIAKPIKKYNIDVLEYLHFQQKRTRKEDISTKFIVFNRCNSVSISNIIIENSPGWNISFEASNNITVSDTVISSNYHGANTDGIDISASSFVSIKHCRISVGDDAICLKNDKYYNDRDDINMENISVEDCYIRSATNGFKIGTGVYNNISNVRVSNLAVMVDAVYPGSISAVTILVSEGGTLDNVTVDGVKVRNALTPIFIRLSNRNKFGDKDMTGVMKNITVKNVDAEGAELPIIVAGVEDNEKTLYIENVTLENINVRYREAKQPSSVNKITHDDVDEAAKEYPEAWMMGDVPASGVYFRHVKNPICNDFNCSPRSGDKREKIVFYDAD